MEDKGVGCTVRVYNKGVYGCVYVGAGKGYICMTIYVICLIYVSVFFIIHGYYLLTYCCMCTVVYDICT